MQGFIDESIGSAIKIGKDYGKNLDFSDESIKDVDAILDDYHERYLHPEKDNNLMKEKINMFAHVFGIYVGEVLRRNHVQDCVWQDTKYGIVLVKDEDSHASPIAKAYKHIVNGKEEGDDIKSFFNMAIMILQNKFSLSNETNTKVPANKIDFAKVSFIMKIMDVFEIRDVGIVVTGVVETGSISEKSNVSIVTADGNVIYCSMVDWLESYIKPGIKSASAGDNIGLMFTNKSVLPYVGQGIFVVIE